MRRYIGQQPETKSVSRHADKALVKLRVLFLGLSTICVVRVSEYVEVHHLCVWFAKESEGRFYFW